MSEKTGYIDLLVAAEEGVRDLYRVFSERFSEPEGVQAFWETMARDEEAHAATLRTLAGLVLPPEEVLEQRDPFLLATFIGHLAGIVAHSRTGRISIQGAVALANGIEHSLAEKHQRIRTGVSEPLWQDLMDQIHQADQKHLAHLRAFSATVGLNLPENV